MDLKEFKEKFPEIRDKGFIKTHRSDSTGVGHTLEQELGLEENCVSGPDLEGYELKAARLGAGGKQTLLTSEGDWILSQMDYMKKYGKPHKYEAEISGTSTVRLEKNNRGLFIQFDDTNVSVCSDTEVIVEWTWEYILQKLQNKFPAMIKVWAETQGSDDDEEFHYVEAVYYRLKDKEAFKDAIKGGHLCIEFRMRTMDNQSAIRNRGTAFRINHDKLDLLFDKEKV